MLAEHFTVERGGGRGDKTRHGLEEAGRGSKESVGNAGDVGGGGGGGFLPHTRGKLTAPCAGAGPSRRTCPNEPSKLASQPGRPAGRPVARNSSKNPQRSWRTATTDTQAKAIAGRAALTRASAWKDLIRREVSLAF
ncbi:uncharacterized protein PSFLO_01091 [Pseudozyma flocculosa]|uniref:Uncharacterized protein n=1 Tax=Pseudozyma flocculosa TaxID=84751 RepID=A0A5C3EUU9_9BASI|nr:uncharacterized protein PSFLO_01091 [Pseudozyma flocculosa]